MSYKKVPAPSALSKDKQTPGKVDAQPQVTKNSKKNAPFQNYKAKRAQIIVGIVVLGFFSSVLYHYYQVNVLERTDYPYCSFLFKANDRFNDFNNIYPFSVDLDPYNFVGIYGIRGNYFPLSYIIMHIFNIFPVQVSLIVFLTSFILFFTIFLYKNLPMEAGPRKNLFTFALAFMTYPFLFTVDRANVEIWLFMSLAMFVFYYVKGNDIWSTFFLSIAICLKLFPAIFFLLFFIDRKYLGIVYTAVISFIFTIGSFAMFKGSIISNVRSLRTAFAHYSDGYIFPSGSSTIQHCTTIWATIKLLCYSIIVKMNTMPPHYEERFNKYYVIFILLLLAILALIMVIYKFSFWKKVFLLLMASIVLQQGAGDYKLLNLFVPMMLFINTDEESRFDFIYTIIFGLLLIPKDYYILQDDVSIEVIINPLLIITMMTLIIYESIKKGEKLNISYYLSFNKNAKTLISHE